MLLPLSASAKDPANAPAKQLRIGFQKAGLLAVLKAQGSLEQKLKPLGYTVSWYEFPAGPQLLEALNTSNIDFGYTGAPPPIFAQAAGVNFVYVGAEPGGETNEALFVKADSPIHTPTKLKGRRIALQKGSSSNFLLLAVLQKAGLKLDDIHPVYLAPADARAAFENGDVDAWIVWDPYYTAAQKALSVRTLADYTGLPKPFNFYEATRSFATQNPQAVRAVIEQLRATGAWVTQHPADTAALLAPKIGLDAGLVETRVRRVPYGRYADRRKDCRDPAERCRYVLSREADSESGDGKGQRVAGPGRADSAIGGTSIREMSGSVRHTPETSR
ncbi:MAG: ABC transporter, substrate-binding protein (cluster 10, nitrate/sulfonate/bicarbonate) [uncultured Caballeronia sp.]|nr:MAG: ABC transporter, substrate-binding protein (cluster 10, nitrate/sulfonate/bicarbonate) [uncultured Caballeronia sp.]